MPTWKTKGFSLTLLIPKKVQNLKLAPSFNKPLANIHDNLLLLITSKGKHPPQLEIRKSTLSCYSLMQLADPPIFFSNIKILHEVRVWHS
jgi:hypothetical protein